MSPEALSEHAEVRKGRDEISEEWVNKQFTIVDSQSLNPSVNALRDCMECISQLSLCGERSWGAYTNLHVSLVDSFSWSFNSQALLVSS